MSGPRGGVLDGGCDGGRRPRLAFVGLGWIGLHRLRAVADSRLAEIVVLAEPEPAALRRARHAAPAARVARDLDEVLERAGSLDAVVLATPSALHAEQALACLRRGLAVHCQKPLGRDAAEVARVVEAAAAAGRRLGVDLGYRHVRAAERLRQLVRQGDIGRVFAAELQFHDAFAPDKAWFYDRARSGGGCAIDLGVHLVDLLLHVLDFPGVDAVQSRLFAGARRLLPGDEAVEDHAVALLDLQGGALASLACSWRRPAGRDAVVEAAFYGTDGGLALRNVGGSLSDFRLERYRGATTEVLVEPPDAWSGQGLVAWVDALSRDAGFDAEIEQAVAVAQVLDRVYGRPADGASLSRVAPSRLRLAAGAEGAA